MVTEPSKEALEIARGSKNPVKITGPFTCKYTAFEVNDIAFAIDALCAERVAEAVVKNMHRYCNNCKHRDRALGRCTILDYPVDECVYKNHSEWEEEE